MTEHKSSDATDHLAASHDEAARRPQTQNVARGTRRRLFSSVSVQSLSIVMRVLIQLVTVPICLLGWGASLYRDWVIVFSAVGLLTTLDAGISIYFGNGLLIARSRGDAPGYRKCFSDAMGIFGCIMPTAAVILCVSTLFIQSPALLGVTVMPPETAIWTLGLLAAAMIVLLPFGVVNANYRAHGDYALGFVASMLLEVTRTIGFCLVAAFGGPPTAAAMVFLVVACLSGIGLIVDQSRRYTDLRFAMSLPTVREFRIAMSQSFLYAIPMVTNSVVQNGPVLLLGAFGSVPAAVLAFSVSRTLTGVTRQSVNQLSHAFGGEISHRATIGDIVATRQLVEAAGRLTSASAGLLSGFTLVIGKPFFSIWTHGAISFDFGLISAFSLWTILIAPAQILFMLFLYTNRPIQLAIANVGQCLATIVLCVIFIPRFSSVGAAVSCGLAEFLFTTLTLSFLAARDTGIPAARYLGKSLAIALIAALAGYIAGLLVKPFTALHNPFGIVEFGVFWGIIIIVPAFFLCLTGDLRRWAVGYVRRKFAMTRGM